MAVRVTHRLRLAAIRLLICLHEDDQIWKKELVYNSMGVATYLWWILWLRWSIRLLPILRSTTVLRLAILGLAPVTLLIAHVCARSSESRR